MLVIATIKLKLQLEDQQKTDILDTLTTYSQCVQEIVGFGYDNDLINMYELQRQLYYQLREKYQLPSQLTISALHKASECLKSVKESNGSRPKVKRYYPIRYDARSSTIWMDRRITSLVLKTGRIKLPIQVPIYYNQYLTWKFGSRDLIFDEKHNRFFLHISYEKQFEDSNKTGKIIGIDLGLNNIAVTTQNKFYNGRRIKEIKNRYFRLRRDLQAKGTRSAYRKLKNTSGREQRFNRNINHCISKTIVFSVQPHSIIILEQLKNIRKRMKGSKQSRRRLHSWAFYQLQQFLTYKAQKKSIVVEYMSAKYTSTKCSKCGNYQREQRNRHQFKCGQCGFELNADLNGARNIKQNYQVAQGRSLGDGLSCQSAYCSHQ